MTSTTISDLPKPFPDHTQLPEEDGTFVKNFQEHPQSIILTDSIGPILEKRHPDGLYAIGQDCGIYWRETEPAEKGAEAPDWFYVPDVPPKIDGQYRRSYVLWREHLAPLIVLEFASGDGSDERDRTPLYNNDGDVQKPGKFWVYERIMRVHFYGIFEIKTNKLEVYQFANGDYQKTTPNERGHYPIPPLGIELGLWEGSYQNQTQIWLRWWDSEGNLLLIGSERAQIEKHRAEQAETQLEEVETQLEQAESQLEQAESQLALVESQLERERLEKERLLDRLRAAGIDPNNV